MCYAIGMKASEKINWLTVLLVLWGTMYLVLLMVLSPVVEEVHDWEGLMMVLLKVYEIATVVYLLILSWRLAYLKGRSRR